MGRVVDKAPFILQQWAREQQVLINEAGLILKTEVRRLMPQSPRSGRVYNVPLLATRASRASGVQRRGKRRASAPGEPPAVVTGRLRRSIAYKLTLTGIGYAAAVGSNRVGAATLEYGNQFIRPRPVWRPALQNVLPKIQALFNRT